MTKDEIIAVTLGRMHRSGDAVLLAAAATELVAIQSRLESGVTVNKGVFLPWFLYKDKTDITHTANVDAVDLPTDFIAEYDEEHGGVVFYYDSTADDTWIRMLRQPAGVLKDRYPSYATVARFYDIVNDKIYLRPRPDTAGTLRLLYYARQDSLASVSSNHWTTKASELLITELGLILAGSYVRDAKAEAKFTEGVVRESFRLYAAHIQRLEAGRQLSRGED